MKLKPTFASSSFHPTEMHLIWWILYFFVLPHLLHLINAQFYNVDDNPSASISTSWIINTPDDSSFFSDGSYTEPILTVTGSSGLQFGCGFFCNGTCVSFLFAIFFLSKVDPSVPQVVWSANRNYPVLEKSTLQLTSVGDLVLKDVDGSIVWSTNTSGKSVAGLNLTDTGNLLLFDNQNATVWQSFDHPTDCLLLGQKLMEGQKLTPSVSPTNWTETGFFSLSVTAKGLFASVESNPPQVYYQLGGHGTKMNKEPTYVRFLNGSLALFLNSSKPDDQIYGIPKASSAQYMRFGSDGHLRAYAWNWAEGWTEVGDVLTGSYGDCSYPTVCGSYGICSNGQCSCPPQDINGKKYFEQVNYRQPNLGCREITPLSCEASQNHTFLELKDTIYFPFFMSFANFTWNGCNASLTPKSCKTNVTLESCKVLCLKNCSCKAVYFQYDSHPATGNCYMPSKIFSLMNNDEGYLYNSTVYVKVQNISNIHNFPTTVPRKKKTSQVPMILGSSIGSFVGLFILIGILMLLVWKKGKADEVEEDYLDQVPGMLTRFLYENLKAMTGNFCKVLGEGGFGSVFEGTLADGTKIAVKQLNGKGQVNKSFLTEVEAIGSIHHVNLSKVVTTMRGTPGYLAPEWLNSAITEKVDTYSFGVVTLEIVCERRNFDRSQPEEQMHLLSHFEKMAEENRLLDLVDNSQNHEAEKLKTLKVAAWCLQRDHAKRPRMSVVVNVLEGVNEVENNIEYHNLFNPTSTRMSPEGTPLLPSILSAPSLHVSFPMTLEMLDLTLPECIA
ncbi:unnamed protein product [Dovyalis caffra]|uniref:Receptor-like serine/threonine-protein kinase n=1 Tax=Dovyalis caffra TaxID=77055 RepID=A0AAV1QRX3_9ROSI|nr:unnamed protein product [Dovyalis caffra]